ncbi:DUF4476 domain-containing protein [Pontibacter sp. KCTC 32443]|uniref:DUF4476 domain-containing protein n=1 Tax=Pontibacter TaxID=323449 RepID=UPI00164E2A20|nr:MULTISPECIES: DUF4476 domain-containing protein [Pontibacter]MBC5774500.1 DUF4476 domain-containing protein [Pontibacter sp. KCTC 32443]
MRKLLLPLLLVLLAMPVLVQASVLTFRAPAGEPFYLKLNGKLVNHKASNFVRIDHLRPGKHYVEVKVRSRYRDYHLGTKVYARQGYETNYGVDINPHKGKIKLRILSEVPLLPPPPPVVVPRVPYPPAEPYRPAPPRYNDDHYDRDRCDYLMSREEVDKLADAMKNRSFESTKLTIAREALRNSSILAEDLKYILQQFDYESTRVEFAKYAYEYVCDRDRFYYVYDVLKFDSSVRELEEYTSRRR